MARALLVVTLVACFRTATGFTTRTKLDHRSRYVRPAPARLVPTSAAADAATATPSLLGSLVPAVPVQERPLTLREQFEPNLIAYEFVLGVRVLVESHAFLTAASVAARLPMMMAFQKLPSTFGMERLPRLLSPDPPGTPSPYHRLEMGMKWFGLKWSDSEPFARSSALFFCITAPVTEELSYRGVAHFAGRLGTMVAFWATRNIAKASKLLAWISVSAGMVGALLTSPIEVVQKSLLLPAEILIVRNATDEGGVQARERAELRARHWCARLTGAHAFGLAHYAPKEMPAMSAISLQKFCGTFCSSLLIESRLVVNRRCLWPAIGAHMAYNSLACVLPWVEAMHRATMQTAINGVFGTEAVVGAFGGPIWAKPGPAWVPLLFVGQCLVVHAVFLRIIGRPIRTLEDWLAGRVKGAGGAGGSGLGLGDGGGDTPIKGGGGSK